VIEIIVLIILGGLCLGGGLGVVASRNVAYATICLLIALLAVAGIYVMLLSEFLALVQVLIYGGAVTIVLLFALMLTRAHELEGRQDNRQRPIAICVSLLIFAAISFATYTNEQASATDRVSAPLKTLGTELFSSWLIPFEITGLILLIVLLGVVIITHKEKI
jgi:NADH-quinone oxidoreductase subunit J